MNAGGGASLFQNQLLLIPATQGNPPSALKRNPKAVLIVTGADSAGSSTKAAKLGNPSILVGVCLLQVTYWVFWTV